MASPHPAFAPATERSAIDATGKWFWNFLKQELTPYPGRLWVVGRITIAATIVMLIVDTFRIPTGFLGAIFTVFISRENPTATFVSGLRAILAFVVATAYALITVSMMAADPMTHFLWVAMSLFLSFFLIRVFTDYGTAVAFGFLIAGAIPLWDFHNLNVEIRVENTLWTTFVVIIGITVSIAVEYVFRRVHPTTDLTEGIEVRLHTAENLLRCVADERPVDEVTRKRLDLYSTVGSSRLRRLILRSDYGPHFKAQMSAAIALIGRLVDIAGSFQQTISERAATQTPVDPADRERCRRLADEIALLRRDLMRREVTPESEMPPIEGAPGLPFLAAMETTVQLIPKAFAGSESMDVFGVAPFEEDAGRQRLFLADTFTNPEHVKFAIRGTLAAMTCYVVYQAIDWRGLSTSLATCFITALSTIGSSRQKQILRLAGAFIGGVIFAMGSQIFVQPYIDGIAGFTPLYFIVTAIAAWIATASGRLSYLGVQLALAFYVVNLQEFTIQTSLGVARDRVVGVMLGLVSMWLLFDRLWVRKALDEMQAVFARNLEAFAQIAEQLAEEDHMKAMVRIRILRDQINAGFQAVNAQSDAVLFEFGRDRPRKLQLREDVRRWQPTIRTLLLVQITIAQYRAQRPLKAMPEAIARAQIAFQGDVAAMMRTLANIVAGKHAALAPNLAASAARLQDEIRSHYQQLGQPLAPFASDIIGLTQSLVSTLTPLYQDIQATFTERTQATQSQPSGILPNPLRSNS
jgi:multidrug resistance protein MdtO